MQNVLGVYEQEINYKFFSDREKQQEFSARFDTSSLLRLDIEGRYKTYREGIDAGSCCGARHGNRKGCPTSRIPTC